MPSRFLLSNLLSSFSPLPLGARPAGSALEEMRAFTAGALPALLLTLMHRGVLLPAGASAAGSADGTCPSGFKSDSEGVCREAGQAAASLDPYGLEDYVRKHPVMLCAGHAGLAPSCFFAAPPDAQTDKHLLLLLLGPVAGPCDLAGCDGQLLHGRQRQVPVAGARNAQGADAHGAEQMLACTVEMLCCLLADDLGTR